MKTCYERHFKFTANKNVTCDSLVWLLSNIERTKNRGSNVMFVNIISDMTRSAKNNFMVMIDLNTDGVIEQNDVLKGKAQTKL